MGSVHSSSVELFTFAGYLVVTMCPSALI